MGINRNQENNISDLVLASAKSGVRKSLQQAGIKTCESISVASAYRLFGRSDIDRWIKEGLLVFDQESQKKLIRKNSLQQTAKMSNRMTYLTAAER